MKLFRSINRYFRDAVKSVFRNFSLSLASISCITITLIVVALSIVLSYNVEKMTEHVSNNISIVLFLNGDCDDDSINVIKKQLQGIDNVNDIKFKSKEDYADEIKEMEDRFSVIVDNWDDDSIPLLDSYEVTVKDIEQIDDTASTIKKIDDVSSVNYGEEYIQSVVVIFDMIEKVCIGGVIALILVTAFLISKGLSPLPFPNLSNSSRNIKPF